MFRPKLRWAAPSPPSTKAIRFTSISINACLRSKSATPPCASVCPNGRLRNQDIPPACSQNTRPWYRQPRKAQSRGRGSWVVAVVCLFSRGRLARLGRRQAVQNRIDESVARGIVPKPLARHEAESSSPAFRLGGAGRGKLGRLQL